MIIFISSQSLIAALLFSLKSSSHGWRSQCSSQYPSPSKPCSPLPSWTTCTSWRRHQARWCSNFRLSCSYQHHENPCFSFRGCHLLCPKWLVRHEGHVSWTYSSCRLLAVWSSKTWLCFRSTWSWQTRFPQAVRCVGTLFFSIRHNKTHFPCTLVSWYSTTGMWKVKPNFDNLGNVAMLIIHLDSMVCSAHLMGIAGTIRIPHHLTFNCSLNAFQAFFVNKYIDHHAHEYAF